MSDHELTRHETLVRETPLALSDAGATLTDAGESVVKDYSGDSGGSWISCRCGAHFQTDEAAADHLTEEYGEGLRAKAYTAIRQVQDLATDADNERVAEEMERLALNLEERTRLVPQFMAACEEFSAQFVTEDGETTPPEEVLCVVDTSRPEGRDLVSGYDAEVVNGLVVVREVYQDDVRCEYCDTQGAYCLKNSILAVGLCREHLEEDPSFAGVVEDEVAVKAYDLPSAPVLNNGGESR